MNIRLFKNTRIIHKWVGILFAVFILILSVSGFLLMHPEEFGIEKAQISGKYLPAKYFQVNQARRRIQSLITGPTDQQIIYVGTDIGIYRSQDGGKTWLQTNQGLFDQDIRSLVINPKNSNIVYAGTGHGIFKSEDAGNNWSDWFDESAGLTHSGIYDLILHPENPEILFAATDGGVFQSLDAGESWESVFTKHPIQLINFSAPNPDILYASGKSGIFRSKNRGQDWNRVWDTALPPVSNLISLNTDPEFLYSGTQTGLYKSFNGGRNWVTDPTFKKTPIDAIFITPSNQAKIYVGSGANFYSSKSGGDSWENISSFTQKINAGSGTSIDIKINRIISLNKKSLYVGTSSGLYLSEDEGEVWKNIDLSGAVNQLSPDEMKMDVVKLITEIHNGRFFGSYFFMIVDLATIGIVFLTLSGLLIAYYRARVKNRKKLIEDLATDRAIELTETTDELSSESHEIHDMIEHITEHIEKCQLVYMDQEKKEIVEISRHLNTLDKKMHRLMENLGELEKTD
ncbi:MAG: hypothetical protein HOF21_02740 [Nitrospina sp.]|nr:hypothetical protein [Nitrospina sp.]MBT5631337.1 hypothetical protein [Nitrospina sp.]